MVKHLTFPPATSISTQPLIGLSKWSAVASNCLRQYWILRIKVDRESHLGMYFGLGDQISLCEIGPVVPHPIHLLGSLYALRYGFNVEPLGDLQNLLGDGGLVGILIDTTDQVH